MRRTASHLAIALAVIGLGILPRLAQADTVINPQAGVTGANSSSDAANITDSARLGYSFGGNLRIGGMGYIAPGAYYQRTSLKHTVRDNVTLTTITDEVTVNSVYLPLKFGLGLTSPSAGARSFGLRAYAGPAATIITTVKPNTFGITKDDYNKTTWGAELGAGLFLVVLVEFFQVALDEGSFDGAGADGVDAQGFWIFDGELAGHGKDRALAGAVGKALLDADLGGYRADVDDSCDVSLRG